MIPIPSGEKEEKNGNGNCADNKNVPQRPKGISKEQWEQWQKRDANVSSLMLIVTFMVFLDLVPVLICCFCFSLLTKRTLPTFKVL